MPTRPIKAIAPAPATPPIVRPARPSNRLLAAFGLLLAAALEAPGPVDTVVEGSDDPPPEDEFAPEPEGDEVE